MPYEHKYNPNWPSAQSDYRKVYEAKKRAEFAAFRKENPNHPDVLAKLEKERARQKSWRERNKDKELLRWKTYRDENKEKIALEQKERIARDPEKYKAYRASWKLKNPGKTAEYLNRWKAKNPEYHPKYNQENKDSLAAARRKNENKRRKEDPAYRAMKNLRGRLNTALRRAKAHKYFNTFDLLGCSLGRFMEYMACHFKPGMTWANYGSWHSDHIRPCASFDLTDPDQQKQCFHFLNLQPLWAADNLRKRAKYNPTEPQLA